MIELNDSRAKTLPTSISRLEEPAIRGFERLLDITEFGYYEANMDGLTLYSSISECRMLGYNTPEELIGKNRTELWIIPSERMEFSQKLEEDNIISRFPCHLKKKSGQELWVEVTAYKLFDPETDERIGIAGVYSNITKRIDREVFIQKLLTDIDSVSEYFNQISKSIKSMYNFDIGAIWDYNEQFNLISLRHPIEYRSIGVTKENIFLNCNSLILETIKEKKCKVFIDQSDLIDEVQGENFCKYYKVKSFIAIPLLNPAFIGSPTFGIILMFWENFHNDINSLDLEDLQIFLSTSFQLIWAREKEKIQKSFSLDAIPLNDNPEKKLKLYLANVVKEINKVLSSDRSIVILCNKEINSLVYKIVADSNDQTNTELKAIQRINFDLNAFVDLSKGTILLDAKKIHDNLFNEEANSTIYSALSVPLKHEVNHEVIGHILVFGKKHLYLNNEFSYFTIQHLEKLIYIASVISSFIELLSVSSEKGRQLRELKHDLEGQINEPITIVSQCFISLAKFEADELNNEELITDLAKKFTQVKSKLNYLSSELKKLSEKKENKSGQKLKSIQLKKIIYECKYFVTESLNKNNFRRNKIEIHLKDNIPALFLDETKLIRAVTNLFENAIKYADCKPNKFKIEIIIEENYQKHCYMIRFRDWGMGIDPTEVNDIFDEGFRSKKAIAKNIEGQGLGLSIVRSTIESFGGKVFVSNCSEPTEISLTFPYSLSMNTIRSEFA